MSHQFFKFTL